MKGLVLSISLSFLQTSAGLPMESAAIGQFHAEVEKYMAIRRGLLDEVSGPKENTTAVELTHASDALAAAIQRRRPDKRPGSIFTAPVAESIKLRVGEAVRTANLGPVLAKVDDEGVGIERPAVYMRFPAASQMATMPPSLLAALPPLPKELEYRIIGSYLILRDIDAALVIDFIPAAVPRK